MQGCVANYMRLQLKEEFENDPDFLKEYSVRPQAAAAA